MANIVKLKMFPTIKYSKNIGSYNKFFHKNWWNTGTLTIEQISYFKNY